MTAELIELDESYAEDFWRLRKELFTELGEVTESEDLSALEEATKQYFLAHIGRDLISWGDARRREFSGNRFALSF